jgi:BirA family transcriptional regulator, biotin operon repressor / biotin---[acetyl-CoA-carboxylase] ligase
METSRGSSLPLVTPWPDAWVSLKRRTTSTMDDALQLARAGCPTGTVAAADYQEKGRGRVPGRTWLSRPGESLLATVVLRTAELGYALAELPLRAGVAVALGIEDAAGIAVEIKWPNDLVAARGMPAAGRKLAGLLCEAHGDTALVGLGVNCAQTSFPEEITRAACSLFQVSGRMLSASVVLSAVLHRLKAAAANEGWRDDLRARLYRRGQPVRVDLIGPGRTLQGILQDVDDQGRLVLELNDGRREIVTQGELLTSP